VLVFDLFSGTGSSTQAFRDAGHTVISFEMDKSFEATEHIDIFNLRADEMIAKYGQPDFVWASPPRTACKNGMPCHESAPRGARTGTQGIVGAKDRSRIPYALGEELLKAMI